jgi:beta-glucosidase
MAHNRLGIPALFIEEALHGYGKGTVFPAPINLAATWNRDLAQQTGAAIAAEARSTGVDMILAPVLDLARDPRGGVSKRTSEKIRILPDSSDWHMCAGRKART